MAQGNTASSLEPYARHETPEAKRAQALRLVRHLFGPEVDLALATAIALWVATGAFGSVLDIVSREDESR